MPNLPTEHQNRHYAGKTYPSGIRMHGGSFTPSVSRRYTRWHAPYSALILLKTGTLDFALGGRQYHAAAPAGIYIRQTQPALFTRGVRAGETVEKYTFAGIAQWLDDSSGRASVQLLTPSAGVWALLDAVQLEKTAGAALLAEEAAVMQLLAALWQDCRRQCLQDNAPAAPALEDDGFDAALSAAYAAGAHSADALAAALHLSPRTLNRKLQQHFGITTAQWLMHKRMFTAARALEAGESLGEAAYHSGYRSVSSFVQAFKKYYGATPKQWQEQGG